MTQQASCRECGWFVHDAQALEEALPGLNILSSAFGAVRADTGLCRASETLTTPRLPCPDFRPLSPSAPED
jgi:hypothetical protein